jgi:hypothetical protein
MPPCDATVRKRGIIRYYRRSYRFLLALGTGFTSRRLPNLARETVVVRTGVGHDKYVLVCVEQGLPIESGAALGTVVPIRRWMKIAP